MPPTGISMNHGRVAARNIYAIARRLLEEGLLAPEDRLETWRDGSLCMWGIAGKLAKLAVTEHSGGNPSLSLTHWKPFGAAIYEQGRP